jgi:hypothetical protein
MSLDRSHSPITPESLPPSRSLQPNNPSFRPGWDPCSGITSAIERNALHSPLAVSTAMSNPSDHRTGCIEWTGREREKLSGGILEDDLSLFSPQDHLDPPYWSSISGSVLTGEEDLDCLHLFVLRNLVDRGSFSFRTILDAPLFRWSRGSW